VLGSGGGARQRRPHHRYRTAGVGPLCESAWGSSAHLRGAGDNQGHSTELLGMVVGTGTCRGRRSSGGGLAVASAARERGREGEE
jgi:hypothetical protein